MSEKEEKRRQRQLAEGDDSDDERV